MEIIEAVRQARLYGILDLSYIEAGRAADTTLRMLEGGVQIVQLRAKKEPESVVVSVGSTLASLCRNHGVPFVLNDYPHLVSATGADGVHIGQDDLPVAEARQLAGANSIVGKSTHALSQAVAATREQVDYIGFGPLFATPTKPEYAPIGTREIEAVHGRVALPVFCIGGVKRENIRTLMAAGASRVVIVSGILQAPDIVAYCRECRRLLDSAPLPGV